MLAIFRHCLLPASLLFASIPSLYARTAETNAREFKQVIGNHEILKVLLEDQAGSWRITAKYIGFAPAHNRIFQYDSLNGSLRFAQGPFPANVSTMDATALYAEGLKEIAKDSSAYAQKMLSLRDFLAFVMVGPNVTASETSLQENALNKGLAPSVEILNHLVNQYGKLSTNCSLSDRDGRNNIELSAGFLEDIDPAKSASSQAKVRKGYALYLSTAPNLDDLSGSIVQLSVEDDQDEQGFMLAPLGLDKKVSSAACVPESTSTFLD